MSFTGVSNAKIDFYSSGVSFAHVAARSLILRFKTGRKPGSSSFNKGIPPPVCFLFCRRIDLFLKKTVELQPIPSVIFELKPMPVLWRFEFEMAQVRRFRSFGILSSLRRSFSPEGQTLWVIFKIKRAECGIGGAENLAEGDFHGHTFSVVSCEHSGSTKNTCPDATGRAENKEILRLREESGGIIILETCFKKLLSWGRELHFRAQVQAQSARL